LQFDEPAAVYTRIEYRRQSLHPGERA
jgi:hypothetical protein